MQIILRFRFTIYPFGLLCFTMTTTTTNAATTMTTIKLASKHNSLASAVEAANPDLSYNPAVARQYIRETDRNCREAFVSETGDVYFVFDADIQLLHKFNPFVSCLDSGKFRIAFVVGMSLSIGAPTIPKTKEGRKFFKTANKQFGAFAA